MAVQHKQFQAHRARQVGSYRFSQSVKYDELELGKILRFADNSSADWPHPQISFWVDGLEISMLKNWLNI